MQTEKQNIIVMGGSFNPPTIAHLKIVQAAMDAVHAEKGYLVPVSHAYLKRKMVKAGEGHMCLSDGVRLAMLEAMCKEDSRIAIYTEEMEEPFAITYETMSTMQELYPEANLFFVAGADKIGLIEEFTRKSDFLERFKVAVFARNNENPMEEIRSYENLLPYQNSFVIVNQPEGIEMISSTAVRRHMFDIETVANMLHPDVVPILKGLNPSDFPKEIIQFKGEYAFLDNSFPADIEYEGLTYPSAESAFQASKLLDHKARMPFTAYKQDKVKQRGNSIKPYDGWEAKQLEIMEEILREKFLQHPDLYEKLLQSREYKLIAGNQKKDKYWGVNLITWEGENHLGEILMKLRNEFEQLGEEYEI
ncbi:MAG: NADAR domain-containing protein [Lachnospiraceae bacterium]|nr:NADAR domain-containing protein [Lachnospiraceae bacterium]